MHSKHSVQSNAKSFWVSLLIVLASAPGFAATSTAFEVSVPLRPANKIDELVFAQLKRKGITPANVCSDAVFVRRVYLDVIGTLPTAVEAESFILDKTPTKRSALIERLLAREEFADYQAMKWSDLLRVKAEFPINLWPNAAQAYHGWLRENIRTNAPYDQLVRGLLTASGSDFENAPVNFYRALESKTPSGMAQAVALAFMGTRTENWPSNKQAEIAVFFANVGRKYTSEWKEEIIFFDQASTNTDALNGSPRRAVFPDGTGVTLTPDRDPRAVFADWLVAPKNPWFTRNIVNREWSWLLGRGIIEEPDDIRPDNPPSNPELLAYLEKELVRSDYDLKHIYRLILNSRTYQLSSIPQDTSPNAAANFASYPLRRMDAEVLIDAIDQLTGGIEEYSSAIPEPYTFIPDNVRSIALPDGSITSAFLEKFGRSPRDTGRESERNNHITAAQKLWLLNSSEVQHKIEQSRMVDFQSQKDKTPPQIVSALYLGILSRLPTSEEATMAEAYFKKSGASRRQSVVDLAWALMNTSEFLYRH